MTVEATLIQKKVIHHDVKSSIFIDHSFEIEDHKEMFLGEHGMMSGDSGRSPRYVVEFWLFDKDDFVTTKELYISPSGHYSSRYETWSGDVVIANNSVLYLTSKLLVIRYTFSHVMYEDHQQKDDQTLLRSFDVAVEVYTQYKIQDFPDVQTTYIDNNKVPSERRLERNPFEQETELNVDTTPDIQFKSPPNIADVDWSKVPPPNDKNDHKGLYIQMVTIDEKTLSFLTVMTMTTILMKQIMTLWVKLFNKSVV